MTTLTVTKNVVETTITENVVDTTVTQNVVNVTTANGVTDHGLLTGLLDDDHPQYLNVTRADLLYAQLDSANAFVLGPNVFHAGADANVALAARRHSSGATANIFEAQNELGVAVSFINPLGGIVLRGHSAIGSAAVVDQSIFGGSVPFSTNLGIYETITTPVATTWHVNLAVYQTVDPNVSGVAAFNVAGISDIRSVAGNANNINYLNGHQNTASHAGSGTATSVIGLNTGASKTSTGPVTSLSGITNNTTIQNVTGTVTTAYGVRTTLTSSGTVTTAYGIQINTTGSSGSIGTLYGLFISNQNVAAAATKYAIWTNGGEVRHLTGAAATIGMIIQAAASQSANLQEWHSSSNGILSTISENGYFTTRKTTAPADAELSNSEVAFWFDATAGAAKLKIKAKNASGTVVNGEVALT